MTITFKELTEHLKALDEITLLEKLDISSEEIVDRFEDKIEERIDSLVDDEEILITDEEDDNIDY